MKEPFTVFGHSCTISVSVGICSYPADGDNVEELLQKADAAMYFVKKEARNGYWFYRELE